MNAVPRLAVELVPEPAWRRNVRSVLATETWDWLRWYLGAARFAPPFLNPEFAHPPYREKLHCRYCGAEEDRLDLHEVWRYNDRKRIQRLVGLKPICSKCHLAKHIGYANVTGKVHAGLAQLAKVNGWTKRQAKAHVDRAFEVWTRRSEIAYQLDLGFLERYVPVSKIHIDWLDRPRTWVGTRLDAIVWANRLLDSDAIVLDTETTGLLSKSNVEVIELAAINVKGKRVFESLFRPQFRIPKRVIKIHGITNEEAQASPAFADQAERLAAILNGKTIVTFNAKFDREVIARTFRMNNLDNISARWECAMHAYRTFSGSRHYLPLPGKRHRALADCRATLKLIRKIARTAW